jgi:predicted NAD/FAD-dependent oxidoreductase
MDMEIKTDREVEVLVIGAGMAGLLAARALREAGRKAVVIDKGRGLGGRMATRRIGGATFDHGAQFITARDARFAALLEEAGVAGAASEWCRGFSGKGDGHARWRGVPGMTGLARYLAQGLEIVQEKQVEALRVSEGGWTVEMTGGESWAAKAVILTAPVPQSLVLLAKGGVVLPEVWKGRLEAIEYERCLAVMAVLDGPSNLPEPGGFAPAAGPIAWMADNQKKGVSVEAAVTIHATPAFSFEHWDKDRDEAARVLLEAAAPWLGVGVKTVQVHGWKFSKPVQVDAEACAVVHRAPMLVLAGDSFCGSRVEGAALSGWAAAEAVLA